MLILGRRGRCLLLGGLLWIMQGFALLEMAPPARALAPHEHLPETLRVVAWMTTAFVAMASAGRAQGRDRWGFFALMLMPAERACSWLVVLLIHFWNWVFGHDSLLALWLWLFGHPIALPEVGIALSGFATWTIVAGFIYNCSGWPEPGTKVILGKATT